MEAAPSYSLDTLSALRGINSFSSLRFPTMTIESTSQNTENVKKGLKNIKLNK